MEFLQKIFRAYDIRGIYEEEITPELMVELGRVFGSQVKLGERVVIGTDARFSSQPLKLAFSSGLLSSGVGVVDLGICPIGMISFGIRRLKAKGGALIGASHNPLQFNGIKFFSADALYSNELNQKIKRGMEEKRYRVCGWKRVGKVESLDFREEYIEFVASRIKLEKRLRVGIDCMNGSTSKVGPELFERIGAKVFPLRVETEKLRLTPEPLPERVRRLREVIRKKRLDLGVAFDGDGDRFLILDELGNPISSSRLGAFLIKSFAKRGDKVVANVECSDILEEVASDLGVKVIRVRVGRTFTLEALKRHKAKIGVERVGHFFLWEFGKIDDALIVSAKICEILSKSGEKFSELMKEIPEYPSKRISIPCPDEKKFRVVENLREKFEKRYRVEVIDGVKVVLEKGWVLIRASNTEPAIRINIEAKDEKELRKLMRYVDIVKKEVGKV